MLARKCLTIRNLRNIGKARRFSTTVDADETEKFNKLSSDWWKDQGSLRLLHVMNKLRVPLIRDGLIQTGIADRTYVNTDKPLTGLNILDVGCGGGILTEALARIGAKVKGIDASEDSIARAESHVAKDPDTKGNVRYEYASIDDMKSMSSYDAVVASEVAEHVSNLEVFISGCCNQIKPGGSLFITTINRTWLSHLLVITAAEKILKIVPDGTHEWDKFVPPDDLEFLLDSNGMRVQLIHGMCYNPLTSRFSWSDNVSANYALHAVKNESVFLSY